MPEQRPTSPADYKRIRHYNAAGEFHYLTFSCFRQRPFLVKDRCRRWLVEAIDQARVKHPFRLIGYVFMPEHAHLLILPLERPYEMAAILASIKVPVARKARRFVMENAPAFLPQMLDEQPNGRRHVRFWQRGPGYDRNVYTGDELWEKIQYIHNNPVRRKLVQRATEWAWSSAADYAAVREGPLKLDNKDLPWRERK